MAFPLSDAEHAAIKARIEALPELIVAAAIRTDDVVVMVERPGRHGNCINYLHWLKQPHDDQGFVTSHGRFVDRVEAAEIATAAGQATPREGYRHLFSEDVWNDWDQFPETPVRPEDVFGATEKASQHADDTREATKRVSADATALKDHAPLPSGEKRS